MRKSLARRLCEPAGACPQSMRRLPDTIFPYQMAGRFAMKTVTPETAMVVATLVGVVSMLVRKLASQPSECRVP
ncbi:hypothetical protein OKW30_001786 [Paraburkholderia sp. Clong3]|nr:hypothetical protein [Paraburkholderia sp. CI2]